MGSRLASVADLKIIELPKFVDERGVLLVLEHEHVPFPVVRTFWIKDVPINGVRGEHAHRLCRQFIVCTSGRITLRAFDGSEERSLALEFPLAIDVPPAIFASFEFLDERSSISVLCDRPYEADDYIYDRAGLIAFRERAGRAAR